MNWTTVLTSTVFAAVIAALISIINTLLINKLKSDDSLRLFRYTKLYEISYELRKANMEMRESVPLDILSIRRANIMSSYTMARPLVDEEYWGGIDKIIEDNRKIVLEILETDSPDKFINDLNESLGILERCFNAAVDMQMKVLLKSR